MRTKSWIRAFRTLALAASAATLAATTALAFDNRHTVRPGIPFSVYGYTWDRPPLMLPVPPYRTTFPYEPPYPGAIPVYTPPTFRFTGGYPYATPSTGFVTDFAYWP